jgi:hypothetical protein
MTAKHTTDTTATDDETREFLDLLGMAGLLQRRLDDFKARLTDDMSLQDIVDRAAVAYGRGDPSQAAIWLPTMRDQAHWFGLFENPLAPPAPSVTLSCSSGLAH